MRLALGLVLTAVLIYGQLPGPSAVVSGTVIESSNSAPVRKAIVTLTLQGTPRTWATARTDGSGNFRFDHLPAGKYDLRAAKNGTGTAIYGANTTGETAEIISLAAGETRTGLLLHFIRTSVISGHVFDSAGLPLATVNVTLFRLTRNLGERTLGQYRSGMTDDHGEYHLSNLDAGEYYLQATPLQNAPQGAAPSAEGALVAQYYGGAREWKDSRVVSLRDGVTLTALDFHLIAEPVHHISGRIIGVPDLSRLPAPANPPQARMRPPGAVEVSISPATEGPARWTQSNIAQPPAYQFDFGQLAAGAWLIEARIQVGTDAWTASQRVDSSQGAGGDIVLQLAPALDIEGQLRIEGKLDATPQIAINGRGSRNQNIQAKPGADGHFTLKSVSAGEWALNLPQLPLNAFVKSATFGNQDVRFSRFQVLPGPQTPLNIVVSSNIAKLEGDVAAGAGDSKRAGIVLAPTGKFHDLARFYYGGVADDQGKFHMENIAPGTYRIFALEKMAPVNFRNAEIADKLGEAGELIELAEGAVATVHPKLIPMERAREALPPEFRPAGPPR